MDSDRASAWVVAVGVGLIGLMVGWLVFARLTALVLDQPGAAVTAMLLAITSGAAATVVARARLHERRQTTDDR